MGRPSFDAGPSGIEKDPRGRRLGERWRGVGWMPRSDTDGGALEHRSLEAAGILRSHRLDHREVGMHRQIHRRDAITAKRGLLHRSPRVPFEGRHSLLLFAPPGARGQPKERGGRRGNHSDVSQPAS